MVANAIKASGVLVQVTPADFETILGIEKPLVLYAKEKGGPPFR